VNKFFQNNNHDDNEHDNKDVDDNDIIITNTTAHNIFTIASSNKKQAHQWGSIARVSILQSDFLQSLFTTDITTTLLVS
jgi:hypothetical protein